RTPSRQQAGHPPVRLPVRHDRLARGLAQDRRRVEPAAHPAGPGPADRLAERRADGLGGNPRSGMAAAGGREQVRRLAGLCRQQQRPYRLAGSRRRGVVQEPQDQRTEAMNDPVYQELVVGTGAGGAMAAYELTRQGHKVLLLEAGRHYDPRTETPMFRPNADAPLMGASTPDKDFGFYDSTINGGWQVPDEPYTTAEGTEFLWWRSRMLGGRTNHWGRYSLRFSQHDFKGKSRDGLGADWPIDYDDIAPWYDRTEALVGVCGTNTGLDD